MHACRSNLSYNRYWEGRSQLQQMTAKLSDAITTTLNFDKTAVPKTGATQEQIEEHKWFRDTFVHLISLFHGVALATLRGDYNMENIVVRHRRSRWAPQAAAPMEPKRVWGHCHGRCLYNWLWMGIDRAHSLWHTPSHFSFMHAKHAYGHTHPAMGMRPKALCVQMETGLLYVHVRA